MIALNNLEIFDNSRIQRFGCFSEFTLHQCCDIGYGTLSIDQRPDKSALCVKMDFCVLRFVEYLLCNFIEQSRILHIQYHTSFYVLMPVKFFGSYRN